MQTFLPFPDFVKSAEVLDTLRLGKQRVETLQILNGLLGSGGWTRHPASRMWKGHEGALLAYQEAICLEWAKRGGKDTCFEKSKALAGNIPLSVPPWWGREVLHRSHRSNLLRKLPEHYGPYFEEDLPADLPYHWPVDKEFNLLPA